MGKFWRPLISRNDSLKYDIFQQARLKLTALYIGIIAIILIIFSLTLFYALAKNIRDNFEGNFSDEQTQELVIAKTTNQLQTTIFFADLIVILVSSGLSYVLAGKTLRPIQLAMEKQRQFTADASHELRTPLAVIQTNLEVALREKEWNQEKARGLVASVVDEVKLMTKLAEDLLTLSNLEGKEKVYELKRVDIAEIVERVVNKMQNIGIKNQIQLSVAPSPSTFIKGDIEALRQLIMNIVSNALNFTPAGGTVRAATNCREGKAIISVRDTGIGIAKENLPRIFERLYRTDRARGRNNGGAGLGLAIAKEIVQRHHGAINIESEIGKGTSVTIVFPEMP